MDRHDVHVCLVDDHAVANITPLVDPGFKPKKVVLVASASREKKALSLASVIKPRGVEVEVWPIADAWDVSHIYERIWQLLEKYHQADLALNVSGGTRPMSLAAYEVFRDHKKPIFYVHPELDKVVWMQPHENVGFDLADRIKIPEFLQAQGTAVLTDGGRKGVPKAVRELTQVLVDRVVNYSQPLATMNYLASVAENHQTFSATLERQHTKNKTFMEVLSLFEAGNVLSVKGHKIHFQGEGARFFANGGWLEDYVYGVIFGLRKDFPEIQDVRKSVEVTRKGERGSTLNELDVVFLANNRLYVIECKTMRWKQSRQSKQGANAIYKLDTLQGLLGGIQGQSMLVSYQPLRDVDRIRASDLGVKTCMTQEIQYLDVAIRNWL
ncbi:MAG: DUF1887 family protein [Methylococcales bacterium]|nr:DUF1887 family protein [Methylococcales bacterium]